LINLENIKERLSITQSKSSHKSNRSDRIELAHALYIYLSDV